MPVAPFLQIAGQPPPGPAQTAPQPQAYQYPGYYAPPPAPGPLPAPQYAPLKYQVQQQEQQAHMQPPAPQHYQQQQAPPRPPQHHGLQSPPMAPLPGSQFRPSLPQGPSLPGTYRQAQYDLQGHVQGRQGQFQSPQANMQRPPASTLPQSPLAAGSKVDTAKNRAININKRITTATQAKVTPMHKLLAVFIFMPLECPTYV